MCHLSTGIHQPVHSCRASTETIAEAMQEQCFVGLRAAEVAGNLHPGVHATSTGNQLVELSKLPAHNREHQG